MGFLEFEIEAIRKLTGDSLDPVLLTAVLASDDLDVDFTGVGYFATVAHEALPAHRHVFSEPNIIVRAGDVEGGFVVFVENRELSLECHSYGDYMPDNFRDGHVSINAT